MIELSRTRTAPPIPNAFHGAGHRANALILVTNQRAILRGDLKKHEFDTRKWKPAKKLLLADTVEKCAYCESPVTTTGFGDVEHYRPKSVYWWLAYALENYLASCAICNQSFKKDKFPRLSGGKKLKSPKVSSASDDAKLQQLAADAAPDPLTAAAVDAFRLAHLAERPALLNPYLQNPEDVFAWEEDDIAKEVRLVPRAGVPDAEEKVKAAETVYGLNRSQLLRDRYFFYKPYSIIRQAAKQPGVPAGLREQAKGQIRFMQQPEHPYAAMLRFFAARDGLPGP